MVSFLNLVAAVAVTLGAAKGENTGNAAGGPSAVYVVHFENASTGYPVAGILAFGTKAEAEAFARAKAGHGYSVRVEVR